MIESPVAIACLAIATALNPDPQTMFTVLAGTDVGNPPPIAAWRAVFWP